MGCFLKFLGVHVLFLTIYLHTAVYKRVVCCDSSTRLKAVAFSLGLVKMAQCKECNQEFKPTPNPPKTINNIMLNTIDKFKSINNVEVKGISQVITPTAKAYQPSMLANVGKATD